MKKLIAAALLAASLAAPAQANNAPTRTWCCSPSGMTILTSLNRIISWTCAPTRPMNR